MLVEHILGRDVSDISERNCMLNDLENGRQKITISWIGLKIVSCTLAFATDCFGRMFRRPSFMEPSFWMQIFRDVGKNCGNGEGVCLGWPAGAPGATALGKLGWALSCHGSQKIVIWLACPTECCQHTHCPSWLGRTGLPICLELSKFLGSC